LRSAGIDQDNTVTVETPVYALVLEHSADGHTNLGASFGVT
jgi:hypothetical protein